MKLLANENFPITSYKILLAAGYDIEHIGGTNPSVCDEQVMQKAIQEDRIILTFDSDYGELVFKYGYRPLAVIYASIYRLSA